MLSHAEKIMDEKAVQLSLSLRENEADLTNVLIDAARTGFYRRLDFATLSAYVKIRLNIQGSYAFALAALAKRAVKLRHLEQALRAKKMTRACATRILSVVVEDNQEEVVKFACTHTFDQIDVYVAGINCGAKFKESLRKLSDDHFRMTSDLNAEEADFLKRVQAIEAKANRSAKIRNANVAAWKCYLKHNCAVEKSERAQKCRTKNSVPQSKPRAGRVPLTAAQKHAVNFRDKGRCTYIKKDNTRCDERHITEIHHVIPLAEGGTDDVLNLTTLCWHHHDLVHQLEFSLDADEMNFGIQSRVSTRHRFEGLHH